MQYPDELGLWPHQANAVEAMALYLDAPAPLGAALVNIPTGGGKSAVIGTLAHWHPRLRRTLVLAPRRAISDQLLLELGGRRGFFLSRGFADAALPRAARGLKSVASVDEVTAGDGIVVTTLQMIDELRRKNRAGYDRLGAWCDALFVDEGHYEPARSWSLTVRDIAKPTILVTATPYRNDLRLFDLNPQSLHITRSEDLAAENILRRVTVAQADPRNLRDHELYLDSVLAAFVGEFGAAPDMDRKLIIRCQDEPSIRALGDAILRHPIGANGVVCLHENFTANPAAPHERRQPSDPEADGAPAIWVHQHKLLEGVDGPSFRGVSFFGVLGSARALVQQIGRIVRNPDREIGARALLIDHSVGGTISASWSRYLSYDAGISADQLIGGMEEVARAIDQTVPAIVYAARRFRERYEHSLPDENRSAALRGSLLLPPRCQLYVPSADFDLSALHDAYRERILEEGWPSTLVTLDENELILLFTKYDASPLFADYYHMDRSLCAIVARRFEDVLALVDTSRPAPGAEIARLLGRPLARSRLEKLLQDATPPRIVGINARNASLGPSSIRRRSLEAEALDELPPMLDDYQFVASTVYASRKRVRDAGDMRQTSFSTRTIGFGRGGVADGGARLGIDDWVKWAGDLVAASALAPGAQPYLSRFATALDVPPADPRPRSILFDSDELDELFESSGHNGAAAGIPFLFSVACVECVDDGGAGPEAARSLVIEANDKTYSAKLRFSAATQGYQLESDALDLAYRSKGGGRVSGLLSHINAQQGFTILPETPTAVFSDGAFYDPRIQLGVGFRPEALGLDDCLEHHQALRQLKSEKGAANSATAEGWALGSVFQWIDENIDELLPDAEFVVCDDGRKEACDFLLIGRRDGRWVVQMVHAKASKKGGWPPPTFFAEGCLFSDGCTVRGAARCRFSSVGRAHHS